MVMFEIKFSPRAPHLTFTFFSGHRTGLSAVRLQKSIVINLQNCKYLGATLERHSKMLQWLDRFGFGIK